MMVRYFSRIRSKIRQKNELPKPLHFFSSLSPCSELQRFNFLSNSQLKTRQTPLLNYLHTCVLINSTIDTGMDFKLN